MAFFNRKNYVSKKDFQLRFILIFVLVSLTAGLAATSAFNVLAYRKLENMLYSLHFSAGSTGDIILPELVATGLFMVLFILVTTYVTLRLWLKSISGPLFRIKKDVARMAHGDLSFEIVLRTKDLFKDVAEEFNSVIRQMRRQFSQLKSTAQEVSETLNDLEIQRNDPDSSLRVAVELEKRAKGLQESLGVFKLESKS